ncbi:two-component sensor histidine kinase [Gluconacetobacter liquefaciens]|uniref:histidine kinase n=1 Tax=Gluconacetobacter liquefaciens TaxID=89584 RepID=A0A370G6B0_GLULI|nr:HAMP domain-containing sensor histidine kinase [Gluconacetobacter liquefaciens]MBB2185554.1 HAMP domain-containing histidine kinase [Gluconacetobacter liquefaciens]RDI39357.1 signal transduction histidine kinase [Gluconacetobacter liquefaciens]GBQ93129.1 two component sensor histidine kinase [Gluconacetobacter liquefaciens NRIC 0522]GEB35998.1 two-component sensor histidine kinase [Gluconacetobacter liquefaciens]
MTYGSGRLCRIASSLSFRIVLLFAGCLIVSGVCVLLLGGLHSQRSLERQIHRVVVAETTEVLSSAGTHDLAHMQPIIQGLVQHEPEFFYLLQDNAQRVVAGNMLHLHPWAGQRWLSHEHRQLSGEQKSLISGEGVQLDDGYLFIGLSARSLIELRRDMWMLVGLGIVGFSVLGVGGGMLLSAIILGRIEKISVTARRIMNGDMSQRIPYQGGDDEFDHLSHSLNAMLETNEQLIASLRQVSNDIAHDMRRPLSRLRQRLERVTVCKGMPAEGREMIETSLEDLDSALEIFSSLLRISQIEARIATDVLSPVSLDVLLGQVGQLYRPLAEDKGQSLVVGSSMPLMVRGDAVLLAQMLSNLVENAINHTPPGSTIAVTGRAHGGNAILVVADNGPGIPAESRGKVFDRFVRLDASRSVPGSGLGLSLVQAIARLHGGSVALSDNDPGLRCTITIPVNS